MRIAILGPLEVRDAAGEPCPVNGARLRSFVIRLAINGARPVSADLLAEDLWPDDPPADTMNAIQALASRVRSAAGRGLIEHGPAGYRLAVAAGEIDAREFGRLAAAGRDALAAGDPATAREQLGQALALWRGPALADVTGAPFAAATITRLTELWLAATEDRIDAGLHLGQGASLVAEVEELATAHPLRERLRGQLMRALQADGRQAEALRVYEDTRKTLAAELGVDPSLGLAAVHLAILRGEPLAGLVTPKSADAAATATGTTAASPVSRTAAFAPAGSPPTGPAPGTPAAHPENGSHSLGGSMGQTDSPRPGPAASRRPSLPAQLTTFVGRDDELTRVSHLLTTARLVTLTGPGGAGKTRLSIEAAARITSQIPDGAWFVPLAPVRDALDVPQAVLTSIGAAEAWPDAAEAARLATLSPLDRLCEVLAARDLLLVLDNCEHVIDAVAELAARVLAEDPGVRILATSREPVGLTGETLCPVPSLPLPPAGAGPDEAGGYAAVRLFTDRAAAVRPNFTLDDQTTASAVRICRALDGIPLAIELAAARVRSLTPAQVADRLDDRFTLLSVASRGKMPRHQTLRAIVDWSWDLLDDIERTILRRLSVFAGGATPDSAEQVCALAGRRDQVVDVIAALVDKSLVVATGDGSVRYRLLETVRAYAGDRLAEAGESGKIADAHAQYFLDLAETAEPQIRSHDQLTWLNRLTAEHDNCSAALRHFIDTGDAVSGLRMIQNLAWFWIMRDYDTEAGEWAMQVLALTGGQPPAGLADAHTIARIVLAVWRGTRGELDLPRLKAALRDLERPSGPPPRHPLLALALPLTAMLSGDFDKARKRLADGLDHPDPWAKAGLLAFSGHLAINAGEIDPAAAQLSDAYDRFEALGDRWGLSICLAGLGEVAMARGDPAGAVRALEEARSYAVAGVAGNMGEMMRIPLGRARAEAGDITGARADLENGVRTAQRIGEHDDAASGHVELAEIARRGGDLAETRRRLELAVQMVEPRELRPDVAGVAAVTYARMGSLAEQEGDLEVAADWLRRALSVLASEEASLLPTNQPLAGVVSAVAALAAARGDDLRAAELLGLAHALLGYASTSSLEVSRATKAIAAAPDQAAVTASYARGRSLTRADALALTV